ncbi:hypothetical protein [Janthinobacterium sp. RB2R34]|uniref:hypothetical protein n=1 Tax=Janthinobacterium sp. RB2R34 TaxID=3424193 RepID=UPI003F1FF563
MDILEKVVRLSYTAASFSTRKSGADLAACARFFTASAVRKCLADEDGDQDNDRQGDTQQQQEDGTHGVSPVIR